MLIGPICEDVNCNLQVFLAYGNCVVRKIWICCNISLIIHSMIVVQYLCPEFLLGFRKPFKIHKVWTYGTRYQAL